MAVLKCKMCGGSMQIIENTTVCECEYCGSQQTIPSVDNEKKITLFERANRLRMNCEFDKAAGIYENIIGEFAEEAEAYWGLILCKYGIEYVDDPVTAKKVPTCHRSSFESLLDDSDFDMVMEYSDSLARSVYRQQAKEIEEIRKGIIEVSGKEQPYDIFICYKETAEDGQRTIDSVLAQDVYDELTSKGYRVFFSRISLEDKLGTEYEPYIFAALNSAKIMLAFGTDYEYYNAVWVKNEWSRYLKLMAKDKSKHLIPCYKDIDAYDMPKEFAKLQAQDLGKVGATQDLLRGIEKILGKKEKTAESQIIINSSVNTDSLLKRTQMFLTNEQWDTASELSEQILNQEPENTQALLFKLFADNKVATLEDLQNTDKALEENISYRLLLPLVDTDLAEKLKDYNESIKERIENARIASIYDSAKEQLDKAQTESDYRKAIELFASIEGYNDADQLKEEGEKKAKEAASTAQKMKKRKQGKIITITIAAFLAVAGAITAAIVFFFIPESTYKKGLQELEQGNFGNAYNEFNSIYNYKDSALQIQEVFYQEALSYFNAGEFEKAIIKFGDCSGYKEAEQYTAQAVNEKAYLDANTLLEENNLQAAYDAFVELGDFKDSSEMATEAKYQMACRELSNKLYYSAWLKFGELGDYKDSASELNQTVYDWEKSRITSNETVLGDFVHLTVTESQRDTFYSLIVEAISAKKSFAMIQQLLAKLPSSYKDVADLKRAIEICQFTYWDVYNMSNAELIKFWEKYEFTHEYYSNDTLIWKFMEGNWSSSSYYFTVEKRDESGYYVNYNVPWVSKPAGTTYIDFRNRVFGFTDNDSKWLADVYSITFVSANEARFYSYKDGKTYTLYRS